MGGKMTINKTRDGNKLYFRLEGRLDTTAAAKLEKTLQLDDIEELTFDFSQLQYLSSSGLRILLKAQKKMNSNKGKMVVENVNDIIMEVFETTGFSNILTIKNT